MFLSYESKIKNRLRRHSNCWLHNRLVVAMGNTSLLNEKKIEQKCLSFKLSVIMMGSSV